MYGMGFSADKSRFILEQVINSKSSEKPPKFKYKSKDYWVPNTGTFEQWKDFVVGLQYLYYGTCDRYLKALKELLATKKG